MANNKGNISTALKRNLSDGKEYSKLIPPVRCERTRLGEGDTFFTVDAMKDWVEKFSHQTAKLAPLFIGRTLEETVNNIYNFLYNHIQYEADGAEQQLRSPACTWVQRKEGVDCKSFSVFASSILSNLGIKHFIRQIRQPYFFPEEFTHVYVVVPQNQNKIENSATFVLDATKHQNVESEYLEKVDLKMTKLSHIGLNAPAPQDERTNRIVENFEKFSAFLLQKGAPIEAVNQIRGRVSSFTSKGQDPEINVVYGGLKVQGVLIPLQFKEHVPFLAVQQAFGGPKGLGFTSAFGRSGLGVSFSNAFSDYSLITSPGLAAGGIVDAGAELAAGAIPFGGLIKGLLDNLGLAANISNVLKYGLSSWGASATPEEMKKRFAEICYPWLQEKLAQTTMDNVDRQLTAIDVNLRGNSQFFKKLAENHSRAKSTRLANEWGSQECNRLLTETIDGFNSQLQANGVSATRKQVDAKSSLLAPYPITSFWDRDDIKKDRYWHDIPYYVYTVDKSSLKSWNTQQMQQQAQPQTGGTPTNTNTNDYTSGYQPTYDGSAGNVNQAPAPSSGGSNMGLIIAGSALVAAPFLLPMIKKGSMKAAVKAKKSEK